MTMQGPIEERMTIGYGPLPTPDDLPHEEQVGRCVLQVPRIIVLYPTDGHNPSPNLNIVTITRLPN